MKLTVNGKAHEVTAQTLADLLLELDYEPASVATAVNQMHVRACDRAEQPLQANDEVEILTPRFGG